MYVCPSPGPAPQPTSFTPPYGSAVNVRINSTYLTQEVIKQLLMKYKVGG